MQYMKNQSGNTLLITLIILIVFSILGLSLMSLSISGLTKNEIRQDNVRSEDLSEKGIDRITQQINSELTQKIDESNGLTRTNFINILNSTINKYKCTTGSPITDSSGKTGTYKTCIKEVKPTYEKGNPAVENELRKLIVFESHGISGNSTKTMTTEIEIGAESAPETLKYAVGTNINTKDGIQNGEGNLYMHGGVSVKGDFKVDGNIITRDRGYAYLNGEQWISSILPESIPTDGVPNSKIVLGKNFYTFNSNLSYSSHIANNNFSNSSYKKETDIKQLFREGSSPKIIIREPVISPIGITDQRANFYLSNGERFSTGLNSKKIANVNKPNSKVIPTYTERECTRWFIICVEYKNVEKEDATFEMTGNNTFEQLSTIGSLEIENSNSTFKKGLYVGGNLQIGNNNTTYNPSNYSPITLDGPVYVKGNVNIQGANLKSNVLLYVEGDVNIQYSTINGKSLADKKEGSLIIFAKGQIKISNNSVNQDTPSQIKGFFYTEEDLEIFGVGSNIRIEGGISARRIVLNAIRGRASDSSFSGSQRITSNSHFEGVAGQRSRQSRLQIIYDQDIIETFSNLKQPEPIIYKVEPPIVKEREI
ncbi:hypothetical protein H9650_06305 [Psychrobacillus sp. Sa2BUA9]|uniref:Polymer-forming cytoskeletal protein n=1 Tax=Psychrobacillus faecigallinarum TaxID=2762235 RepID=A0ABR8R7F2_9BACI|nr:hypothetical protein [Psychrobacillus faecigallinarum]MBD7943727.1 hypothetical protein [Psychrobacillus faecigallinarum]